MEYDQTTEHEEVAEQLVKIRRRRKMMWLTMVLFFSVFLILVRERSHSDFVILLYLLPFMSLGSIYGFLATWSRCPRCLDTFHWSRQSYNPFARRCRHCGLSLYADKESRDNHSLQADGANSSVDLNVKSSKDH
jgi:endogenous inhibitor of DNA gyrase (YacG/DUF329 family)